MCACVCLCVCSLMQKLLGIGLITETLISLLPSSFLLSLISTFSSFYTAESNTNTMESAENFFELIYRAVFPCPSPRMGIDTLCVQCKGYKSQREVKAACERAHVNAYWTFSSWILFLTWESIFFSVGRRKCHTPVYSWAINTWRLLKRGNWWSYFFKTHLNYQ